MYIKKEINIVDVDVDIIATANIIYDDIDGAMIDALGTDLLGDQINPACVPDGGKSG